MTIGIILILAGILIAAYPPLLSFIVAVLLVVAGVFLACIGYQFKKAGRKFDNPFIDFFFKI